MSQLKPSSAVAPIPRDSKLQENTPRVSVKNRLPESLLSQSLKVRHIRLVLLS